MKSLIGITLATALTLGGSAIAAETAYVSSDLAISLRTTADGNAPAIRGLKVGTPFTIIEKDKGNGFTRIRTEDGVEGWVPSRHIATTSPQVQLSKAQETIDKLRTELKQQTASGTSTTAALESENGELKTKINQLEQELQEAKGASLLSDNSESRNWFLAGGGVLVVGMVIGLILPGIRRKKSSWGDL